jgi:glycosyltransferase involved in cell wall biosynthesis
MKVALLTVDYPPYSGGGVGSLSYELTKGLAKVGVEVVVITRSVKSTGIAKTSNCKIYYLTSPSIPPKYVWYYTLRGGSIKSVLADEKPYVIHDLSAFSVFHPWITKLAPTVLTIQGSPQLSIIRRTLDWRDGLRDAVFETSHRVQPILMSIFIEPNVRFRVYVSRFVMLDSLARVKDKSLRAKLLEKATVIYNGVDVRTLKSIRDRVAKNEEFKDYSITFIGRLMEYKGVRFLIKAFKHVFNELRDVRLHIVGDGPKYNEVKGLVKKLNLENNVTLHRALSREETMKVLARSALLTHPSLYESFGIVIAEAYAMGKPVVTHRAGYSKELVEESKAGLTVNVFDEKEYAGALIKVLTDRNLYKELSQNAIRFATERLDVSVMVRKYMDVYSHVIEGA